MLVDVDANAMLDLLATSAPSGIALLLGDGRGTLAPAPGSPFPAGGGPSGVAAGDLDRDGRNEVVFTSGMSFNYFFPAGGLITILNGNGTSRSRIHVGEAIGGAPTLADLDNNGTLEIVVAPSPQSALP